MQLTRQQFTQKYYTLAKQVTAGTGIYPETLLAMAIVESRAGDSLLSKKYNNFFGIKSAGTWNGASVNLSTKEYYSSTPTTLQQNFRVYSTPLQGFKDFVKFLYVNPRYKKALTAPNFQEQIIEIARAGYATAPAYADIINQVAEKVKDFIPAIAKTITGNRNKLLLIAGAAALLIYTQSNKQTQ